MATTARRFETTLRSDSAPTGQWDRSRVVLPSDEELEHLDKIGASITAQIGYFDYPRYEGRFTVLSRENELGIRVGQSNEVHSLATLEEFFDFPELLGPEQLYLLTLRGVRKANNKWSISAKQCGTEVPILGQITTLTHTPIEEVATIAREWVSGCSETEPSNIVPVEFESNKNIVTARIMADLALGYFAGPLSDEIPRHPAA